MPVNMEAGVSVLVGVEQLLEKEVEEIARDGQEKYVPQTSMSEMLGKLAQKIDFLTEAKSNDQEGAEESEEKALVTFQPSLWPWDAVRTKLRNALTEVCVLSDVLNIIKIKDMRYMELDRVSQQAAAPKPALQLVSKKQSLSSAAEILLQGASRLANAVQERTGPMGKQGAEENDYHSELMRLRQRWRLKRAGNMITGDLTYHSAGSQFWNPGLFEVSKATQSPDVAPTGSEVTRQEPLEVTISSDLEGKAKLSVVITEADQQIHQVNLNSTFEAHSTRKNVVSWQRKLQQAQSNLFCKELFTQLAHEAYNGGMCTNASMVIGNEIKSEIFPGTQLCITYSHQKDDHKTTHEDHQHEVATHTNPLELALHSLLRRQHRRSKCVPTPRPVTAPQGLGMNKRRRLAGPRALPATELVTVSQSETLLDSILKTSRHAVLRNRVAQVLDEIASGSYDLCLVAHWSSLASCTCCHASIHLTSQEMPNLPRNYTCKVNPVLVFDVPSAKVDSFSILMRSSFHLRVGVTELVIVCSDGTRVSLSSHMPDLRNFIRTQVCRYQISAALSVAHSLGWHINHHSHYIGTGVPDDIGSTSGIMAFSPDGHRVVAVRYSPSMSNPVVSVKRSHGDNDTTPACLTDPIWKAVGSDFTEIDWLQMPGKSFAQKFLLLLSACMLV